MSNHINDHRKNEHCICVRVFVSSTFRGMYEVRRYLKSYVFPRIEAEYQKRGVGFSWVDLQWGITSEESRKGETVELCLKEIERCQPFFLGLVGSRAGWTPAEEECVFRTDRIAGFFADHKGKTVTELEFLYNREVAVSKEDGGILFLGEELDDNNLGLHSGSFDCDAEYKRQIRKAVTDAYGEQIISEEIRSLAELGDAVKKMLMRRLDLLAKDDLDPFQKSIRRNLNRQYRLKTFGFCRKQVLDDIFSAVSAREESLIVIDGLPGYGKSTLLAYLYEAFREEGKRVVIRFFNDAVSSCMELWDGLHREIDTDFTVSGKEIRSASSAHIQFMNKAAGLKDRLIVMIDDADLYPLPLGSRKDFLDEVLYIFPDNVTLIITAQAGAFRREQHPNALFYHLQPLNMEERKSALAQIETNIGKRFERTVAEKIVRSEKCGNPHNLVWLVKYLSENAVYENLEELAANALQKRSGEELVCLAACISPSRPNGKAERLYMYLALVQDGLKEEELKRLLPHMAEEDFYAALGRLGSMIQYDERSRVKLVDRTFRNLLMSMESLREYASNYLKKRLLSVIAPDRDRRIIEYVRMNLGRSKAVFGRMRDYTFCSDLAKDPVLWRKALEAAYRDSEMSEIINSVFSSGGSGSEKAFLFSDFLEDKGEYDTAIKLMKIAETSVSGHIGYFDYAMGAIYASLLALYSKNGDFDNANMILKHMGFIIKENIKQGKTPPGADYMRQNYVDPIFTYGQLSGKNVDDLINRALKLAGMMDGVSTIEIREKQETVKPVNTLYFYPSSEHSAAYFIIGQLLQCDDNSEEIEKGIMNLTREEYLYTRLVNHPFRFHNRPGSIRVAGKIHPLDVWEYNTLMDIQRRYFLSMREQGYCSGFARRVYDRNHYGIFKELEYYYPRKMGAAFGFDGEKYYVYGFKDPEVLDEAAYLFWLLSDGSRTVKDIAMYIHGLFKDPDTYMIFVETGQSIVQLYRADLIWFDENPGGN